MQFYGRMLRYLPSIFVLVIGLILSYSAYDFVDKSLRDQQQTEFETLSANFIIKIQDEINHETSLLNNLATSLGLAPKLLGKNNLDQLSSNLIHEKSTLNNLVIVDYAPLKEDYRFIYHYPEGTENQLDQHMMDIVGHAIKNKLTEASIVHRETNGVGIIVLRPIPTITSNQRSRLLLAHLHPELAFGNTLNNLLPNWLNLQLYITQEREHQLFYQHFVDNSSLIKYADKTPDLLANRPEHSLFLPGSIDLYGQRVSVLLTPEKSYFSNTSPVASYVLALGVLLSLALAVYINTLRRRNAFVQQQVVERTATLEELNHALTESISSHETDKEKLAVSVQEMRSLVNSVDGVLWEADLKTHKITYISPQVKRILGFEPEQVLTFASGFLKLVNPDDKENYLEVLENLQADSHPQREFRMSNSTGETVYIRDILSPVVVANEIPLIRGVMLDVTKYKLMHQERSKMEARLRQAQKLESVGQLAAGIAHEINTPAQFVSDNIQFLRHTFEELMALQNLNSELNALCPDTHEYEKKRDQIKQHEADIDLEFLLEDIPEALEQAIDGISRISSIVKAMKEFSHPGSDVMESIDLNHAIDNTLTVARNEWRYVAHVEKVFDESLAMVDCLPGEFNQTTLNMIVNAAHAIADRQQANETTENGLITIKTYREDNKACISISDTGCGIPEDKIANIFDPFFTTKEVGKGSGQGLAIAYSVIVDKHNGSIDVESTPDQGTTFIFKIPFKQETANNTFETHKIALA